jgi:hypothetical protein
VTGKRPLVKKRKEKKRQNQYLLDLQYTTLKLDPTRTKVAQDSPSGLANGKKAED